MVRARMFREDLYYRLSVLQVELPPLRVRTEDISPIVEHFIVHFASEFGKSVTQLDGDARVMLEAQAWPGNVREVRNVIERAVLLSRGPTLGRADFNAESAPANDKGRQLELPPGGIDLTELERDLVVQALERTRGNQTHAAKLLGLNRDQVRYRMSKFGLR
jgi:DNA-binding NtrC family response regulator